jgi:hypothetical protein
MSLINKYSSTISHSDNDFLWYLEQLFIYGLFNDAVSRAVSQLRWPRDTLYPLK